MIQFEEETTENKCWWLKYAFEVFWVDKVTIGVFENNLSARMCYKKVGFIEKEIVQGEQWNIIEMEILRTNYSEE